MSVKPRTLHEISEGIGLHPRSLYELRRRRPELFPDPVMEAGRFKLYDEAEVILRLVETHHLPQYHYKRKGNQ